jgi:hypothetical protein
MGPIQFTRTSCESDSPVDQGGAAGIVAQLGERVHRSFSLALVRYSRFDYITPDIDGEFDLNLQPAPLGVNANWLPESENKGEGLFLQFLINAISLEHRITGCVRRSVRDQQSGTKVGGCGCV